MSGAVPDTIYREDFALDKNKFLSPYVYKQTPSLQRFLHQQGVPLRQPRKDDKFGSMQSEESACAKRAKEILRKPRIKVYNTQYGQMDSNKVSQLAHSLVWTSTSHIPSNSVHLPVKKVDPGMRVLEPKSDMVSFDIKRYEDGAYSWQQAMLLDQLQLRPPIERSNCNDKRVSNKKLLSKRCIGSEPVHFGIDLQCSKHSDTCTDILSTTYLRPCPGYSGFIPRIPPNVRRNERQNIAMLSTMRANYRALSGVDCLNPKYLKTGVFSKTVTLTSPCNPYNKIKPTK